MLNESSSSRVYVILTNWSFGPQKIMIKYLNLRVKVAIGQQRVRIINSGNSGKFMKITFFDSVPFSLYHLGFTYW